VSERERGDRDEIARRRQIELGAFLRARRAALRPEDVGLPAGKRRHVAGLRREEVAQLAQIGLDWYAALGQGRVNNISRKSLRRVISSLRLDPLESEHVISLARDEEPALAARPCDLGALETMVRSYGDGAAFVIDGASNAFVWNSFADEFFAFSSRAEGDRQMLAMMVRDPQMRRVFVNWYETLERMIGVFRSTYATSGGGALDPLVRDLRTESPEFDRLWRAYTVDAPTMHVCRLRSADGHEPRLSFVAFRSIDHPQYTVVLLRRIERPARTLPS
jgi:hypothetical protein